MSTAWAHQRLIWRICLTPIHALGILTAIYRISRRYKTRQLGLDDFVATLAFILDLIYFPTLWLENDADKMVPRLSTPTPSSGLAANIQTRAVQVTIGWLVQIIYPLLTWSAKTSLALTIARIIPHFQPMRTASIIVAYLSTFLGIGILIQTCIGCSKFDKTWTHASPYRCKVAPIAGSIRLGFEVVIDIFLVLIPFCTFFWPLPLSNRLVPNLPNNNNPTPPVRLRLPATTLRLIKTCFTASLLTTSTAIVMLIMIPETHNSKSLEIRARAGYVAFLLAHLTASVSLLTCNLLIVITSLYRGLRTQPKVVEVGKAPVIPTIPDTVNSRSERTSQPASSSEERVATTGNVSENSRSGGRITSRTGMPTSYNVEFTELFDSEFSISEFQRPTTSVE